MNPLTYQSRAVGDSHSLLNIVQSNVVENERSGKISVAWVRESNERRCVVDDAVNDCLGTDGLIDGIGGDRDIEPDLRGISIETSDCVL